MKLCTPFEARKNASNGSLVKLELPSEKHLQLYEFAEENDAINSINELKPEVVEARRT